MRIDDLQKISSLYFSVNDIANILTISYDSAKVTASRYVQKKILTRLKRDVYVLTSRFNLLSEQEYYQLANIIQTPSYVSLTSALSYYGISTQQQRNYVESIGLKRTYVKSVQKVEFSYTLIKNTLYDHFDRRHNFFMASPEKALADAIYLTSLRKYNCDFDAIDFKKIRLEDVHSLLGRTNRVTLNFWSQLCKHYNL